MQKILTAVPGWLVCLALVPALCFAGAIDSEPNDTLAEAIAIAMATEVAGNFYAESGLMQDTFQVTLPADGKVRVTLAGLPASCNVHVVLQRLRPEDEAPAIVLGRLVTSTLAGASEDDSSTGTCSYRDYFSPGCPHDPETLSIETADPLQGGDRFYVTVRWMSAEAVSVSTREGGFLAGGSCYADGPYHFLDSRNAGRNAWDAQNYGGLLDPLAYGLRVEMSSGGSTGDCSGLAGILPPVEMVADPAPLCEASIVGTCSPVEIRQTFHARSQDLGKNVALYWILALQPPWGPSSVYSFREDASLQEGIGPLAQGVLIKEVITADLPPLDLSALRGWTVTTVLGYTVDGVDGAWYDCWQMILD